MRRGVAGVLAVVFGATVGLQAGTKERRMEHAKGTFEVKTMPAAPGVEKTLASGRLTFDKTLAGDLTGTSQGEMWTADTGVKGSAGYVAIEKVTGTLRGRSGTFTVLHQATMKAGGDFDMRLVIVPDSGTGELVGLAGAVRILFEGKKHLYEIDYTLPGS